MSYHNHSTAQGKVASPAKFSDFASRLRDSLEARGLRPADLARALRIQQSTVSRWLEGSIPHAATMDRVAKYLRMHDTVTPPPVTALAESPPPLDWEPDDSERIHHELASLSLSQLITFTRVLSAAKMSCEELMRLCFRRMEEIEAAQAS